MEKKYVNNEKWNPIGYVLSLFLLRQMILLHEPWGNLKHFQWKIGLVTPTSILNNAREIWVFEFDSMFHIVIGSNLEENRHFLKGKNKTNRHIQVSTQCRNHCCRLCGNIATTDDEIVGGRTKMICFEYHFLLQMFNKLSSSVDSTEEDLQFFHRAGIFLAKMVDQWNPVEFVFFTAFASSFDFPWIY